MLKFMRNKKTLTVQWKSIGNNCLECKGKSWWRNISTLNKFHYKYNQKNPNCFGRNLKITGINSFPNHITKWQVNFFFPIFTDYCCYSEFYVLGGALMLLEYSHAVIETLLLFFMLFSTHHSTLTWTFFYIFLSI